MNLFLDCCVVAWHLHETINPRTSLNFLLVSTSEAQKACDDTYTDGFHLGRNTVPLPSIHIQNIDRVSVVSEFKLGVFVSAEWISIFRTLLASFWRHDKMWGTDCVLVITSFLFLFPFCIQSCKTFIHYRQELNSEQVIWGTASRITDGPLCQLFDTKLGM